MTLRAEYYHQGSGEAKKSNYDLARFLSGYRMARDYCFAGLEWVVLNDGRIELATFFNLNDHSGAIVPMLSWDILGDFTVQTGGYFFFGESGTEFNGEFSTVNGDRDFTKQSLFLKCKVSF